MVTEVLLWCDITSLTMQLNSLIHIVIVSLPSKCLYILDKSVLYTYTFRVMVYHWRALNPKSTIFTTWWTNLTRTLMLYFLEISTAG